MMDDDRAIMLRVQRGEHALFAELVDRYRIRLVKFSASKLHDCQVAEDLVQETFLAAYLSRASFNPEFAFSTWIWTILLNLCRKEAVRQKRRGPKVFPITVAADPLQAIEDREELMQWLDQLPEVQADALRLRFFGGLSFQEIASTMECSVIGAKVRVRKGLEKLAEFARSSQVSTSSPLVKGNSDELR